ncbi:MAG TPA: hypothetical protein VMF91_27795 [Bryobacteraceae bacterium]|nr:hypothetical protein [Bryobacteraceae bacterium]
MNGVLESTLGRRRLLLWLVTSFSAIAFLLAVVGIYGIAAYSVTQRTRRGHCRQLSCRAPGGGCRSHACWMIALNRRVLIPIGFCLTLIVSCAYRNSHSFLIVPQAQNYLLRAPDGREVPFPEILRSYNSYQPGRSWMDLRPLMEIRIENAYYKGGASRRGLEGFLGTETAKYEITAHGLSLLSFQSMTDRPADDMPVQRLISEAQMKHRFYRLYFEIFFKGEDFHRSALLGADTVPALDNLSGELTNGEEVCSQHSDACTVFPEPCSVSVEMKVVVNGKPQNVLWGSTLADVVKGQHHIEMKRLYAGWLTAVQVNADDPRELKLPLLPGDHLLLK